MNYFSLRELDTETDILKKALDFYTEAVDIQTKRFNARLTSELDLSRAKTEMSNAQSELADIQRQRAETKATLAVLCGQPASSFKIKPKVTEISAPEIPVGLPSQLLERRPDIAAAERRLAAKNAEIGVAYAAFFPSIRLTGQFGYLSNEVSNLYTWDRHVWSLGPSISLPIFAGGRNAAGLKDARAAYDEALARYRQQILVAFKDIEVSLSQLKFLKERTDAIQSALESTQTTTNLANERYQKGLVNYLDVISAERDLLSQERMSTKISSYRLLSTVRLIKALGGGWENKLPASLRSGY